ncbi:hypothetical protein AB0L44_14995 [Nonomuraea wenchangensis]|uniref:hypothetical protein n=1 Tax=Nonomuraea wenchangensis TaxID=568860 RepID=UPI003430D5DD
MTPRPAHPRFLRRHQPAALLAIFALGTACASPAFGRVIAKRHEPSHSAVQFICTAHSTKRMCTRYMPISYTEPEQWVLTLRSGDDES